ncbi:hypothetical protein [Terrihabitans sp. B22-R8]|uniref:hypothetical protein n=1 Tax=Terrihabitans sp. B22-R8 TaxID=3425128 RepID=UPI00403C8E83
MQDSSDDLPERTEAETPPRTSAWWGGEVWAELEGRFSELQELVIGVRLETEQAARGERLRKGTPARKAEWRSQAPVAYDRQVDMEVRAWNLIPYVGAINQVDIQARIDHAARLVPSLKQRFAARQLTPEFMNEWGAFCTSAGAVQLVYLSETEVSAARKGKAGGDAVSTAGQRRWFAHYFLQVYEGRGKRDRAELALERLINAIVDGEIAVPSRWDVEWFERFLDLRDNKASNSRYGHLAEAYRGDQLSVAEMKRLILQPPDEIPPLDLQIPEP